MKKRKFILIFITLLILIIILAAVIFVTVRGRKDINTSTNQNNTSIISPSPSPQSTISPTPNDTAEAVEQLFPAPKNIDNNIKYGYIDSNGNFVLEPAFDSASEFHDGVAIVLMNSNFCVIDDGGNILFINEGTISDYKNGYALFTKTDESGNTSFGYLDSKGNVVIEPQFTQASNFTAEGKAYVSKGNGLYEQIDNNGTVLESYDLGSKYGYAISIEDGYLIYPESETNTIGVITMTGEDVFKPIYSDIVYLGNDLFGMKKPELTSYEERMVAKQAIFHGKGEQLSDYIYYDLGTYDNGYSTATNDESTFFVGTDGKIVANLPKFEGRGTVRLLGDIISAQIDEIQTYYNLDKKVIWKEDTTLLLSDNIKVIQTILKPTRDVLVKYPQLEGLSDLSVQDQINKKLESIFTDSRKTLKKDDMLSVSDGYSATLMKNLLIINRSGYDYYYGAAHGMPIRDYYHININTGAFYELKDLFLENSDYKTKINQMISNEITSDLKSGESMFFEGSFTSITDDQHFYLQDDAVVIYFYPYDISAYAGGFPEFVIPFEDVSQYINTSGDFWKTFHP